VHPFQRKGYFYEAKTNVCLFKRKGGKGVCVCVEEKKKIVHLFPRRKRWKEKTKQHDSTHVVKEK
jgi:hypothetical protein